MLREVTLQGVSPEVATQNAMQKAAQLTATLPVKMNDNSNGSFITGKYVWLVITVIILALAGAVALFIRKRRQNRSSHA
jgi:LPXTG-motif cell wall-anchored protein